MIGAGHRVRSAPHRQQVMIRGQLEDQHAATGQPILRLLNVQDLVAIAHPGGPAVEAGIGKTGKRFLLPCDLLQRRCEQLTQDHFHADQQHPGGENRQGQPSHRDTGGPRHGQFTATGKPPQSQAASR